ncbi:DUF2793 domain-containing protein [Corticibacterium sp. UT-5YL-CI-8]|nr:DUF2793 domain-containing protein [Tianweitania sp. UT-5YL-CI-8]
MAATPNLNMPYILPSQAQKHVTHNEALQALDAVVQLTVTAKTTTPPGAPDEGERHLVDTGATGPFAGKDGQIAAWQDGVWVFYQPLQGWLAFVVETLTILFFDGSAWQPLAQTLTALQNLSFLGIGTAADAANPFSAKLNKALWTAKTIAEGGDGDLRYTLNKENAARTLSLLMQSNWSGRAEIGLTGSDDLSVKVSPNGSAWNTALQIDRTNATVKFIQGSASAPAIKLGDDDTGLFSTGADSIGFSIGGTAQAYFDSAGRYLIGHSAAQTTMAGGGDNTTVTPKSQVISTGSDASFLMARVDSGANGARIFFTKSRGSYGAPASVGASDELGTFHFAGHTGTRMGAAAYISAYAAGAPGTNYTPGRLRFFTSDGTASPAERLRIESDGSLAMGGGNTVINAARHPVLRSYTIATLPAAAPAAQMIYVADGSANRRIAVSDGTNWRFADGNIAT